MAERQLEEMVADNRTPRAREQRAWPQARGTIRSKRPTTSRPSGATRSIQLTS
ncbi:hypothetical protein ACQR1Y_14725 [Bradyrhizobium sp. HKCCYLRH3099]